MKRPLPFLAFAAGLALLSPSFARADHIDLKLAEEMPAVVKYLKSHNYKHVGVLRFRAQKHNDKSAHFDMGPINGNMAERVENLLVMNAGQSKNPEQASFGVIHEAGETAVKHKVGAWFSKPEERKKLFSLKYPLAWGKEQVSADAFLTGKVSLSEDLKKTTVRIECLDSKASKPAEVLKFTVDTDRHIVRDCNLPYTLTKAQQTTLARSARSVRTRDGQQALQQKTDQVVLQQAQQQQKQPNKPQNPPGTPDGPATQNSIGGIKFGITAAGKPIDLKQSSSQVDEFEMDCPPKGSEVVFTLQNVSTEEQDKGKKLGVVIKVAGYNTIGMQRETPENCRKWLLAQGGEPYKILGFHVGEKFGSLKKFAIKSKEEAKQTNQQLDDSIDLVEVYVFRSGGSQQPDKMTISDRGINSRGLRGDVEVKARSSFGSLKNALLRESRLKKARGRDGAEVIVPDDTEVKGPELNEEEFPNPQEIKHLKIRIRPSGQQPPVEPTPQEKPDN